MNGRGTLTYIRTVSAPRLAMDAAGIKLARNAVFHRPWTNFLGWRYLTLLCDAGVPFTVAPDFVLKFTILCRGQSSYDLIDSACCAVL
jgi:hypothetical protein